jgi:hypothetical protein
MNYLLDVIATIVVAFAAGMVLHRVLWKFFDWVLDTMEKWDDEDK